MKNFRLHSNAPASAAPTRLAPLLLSLAMVFSFFGWLTAPLVAQDVVQQDATNGDSIQETFVLPEPEVTLFDIYLGDKLQGLILVEYDGRSFVVPEPTDLVEQLVGVATPEVILPLVSGPGPSDRSLDGVGTVRFDDNTFRVILALDSKLLFGSSLDLTGRIPEPEKKGSLRQDLRVAFSDTTSDTGSSSSAFTHRTLAGYGKTYLDYDGTLLDDGNYELNRGLVTSFVSGLQFSTGYLRSQGQRFVSNVDYLGVSLQTAEEILSNEETLRGSRLDVFIPSRSRVEFFRGGRLLLAQVLDFGLQEIDTSLFPQGSYTVDIVITEANGKVTRESRFFTKSGLLTVRDVPVFSLAAGQQRTDFSLEDEWFGEASVRWRALTFLDFEGGFSSNEDVGIGTAAINALLGDFVIGLSGAYSTDSRSGVAGSLSGSLLGFGFNSSYSETLDPEDDQSVYSSTTVDDPLLPDELTERPRTFFDQLAIRRRDISAQVSRQVGRFLFSYKLQRNLFADEDERETYGPGVEWRIWNSADGAHEVRLTAEHLTTEGGDNTTGFLSYRFLQVPWTYDIQVSHQEIDGNGNSRVRGDISYDKRTRAGYGTRARFGIEGLDDEESGETLISSAELESNLEYLKLGGFVRDERLGIEDATSYGGTLDASLYASSDLSLSISRPPEEEALFVARVQSQSSHATFALVINGQIIERITPGARVVIGLQPFRTYDIQLRQEDRQEIVQYDAEPYRVTVFPGNVVERTWSAERVFIGLGKIVDEAGSPIPRSRLRGVSGYAVTEDDGSFQAEVTGHEEIVISYEGTQCVVTLPPLRAPPEYFHDYGELRCESSS